MTLKEMLEKRAELIHEARTVLEAAEKENRDLSADENQRYEKLLKEAGDLGLRAERQQKQTALEHDLEQPLSEGTRPELHSEKPNKIEWRSRALREMTAGELDLGHLAPYATPDYQQAFRGWLRGTRSTAELRALQADSDILGGYLVMPTQMVDRLIQAVDDLVYIRQWASLFTVTGAQSLGAPSLDADPADPTWTSELLIGTEDSSMNFGRRELNPHPLAKYIKLSRKLIRLAPGAEQLAIQRLAYKFAVVFETACLTGTGANQPLGVFTASAHGINTDRDYSTGNTATSIMFDGLIGAKYTLKGQYWPNARWLFHRDAVAQIAKLKDGSGNYAWRESVRVGEPDRILGIPVFMSEYAPNTFTASQYVGILGDFSYYWIADSLQMEMQRLEELFASTNQVGLIGRLESDGMPVLSEAFVRVKLAAS